MKLNVLRQMVHETQPTLPDARAQLLGLLEHRFQCKTRDVPNVREAIKRIQEKQRATPDGA